MIPTNHEKRLQTRLSGLLLPHLLVLALSTLVISGCTTITVTPGKVYGNISYTSTSPAVIDYLNSTSVDPCFGFAAVGLYDPGRNIRASGEYSPDNTIFDPQTYQTAHFEVNPNVEMDGTDLLLTVDHLNFDNGATYRFGSTDPLSPFSRLCNAIKPMEINSEGTRCDIVECPSLIELHFRLIGTQADLDAIRDDPAPSIPCQADIYIEDIPGSNDYRHQASSGRRLFALSDLLSGDAQIAFLIRGVNSQVNISLMCAVPIEPGETGFVIIPNTNTTQLSSETAIDSAVCGSTVSPPVIEIPVERNGGNLTGFFDISGFDEFPDKAQVCVDNFYSQFCITPPSVPAGTSPTQKWQLEGVQAGFHSVMARAIIEGGDYVLEFPQKTELNNPIQVSVGATADLGSTFVSHPITAHGQLKLFDPGGRTDLKHFVAPPFVRYRDDTSFMQADGNNRFANADNGASGINGLSMGRLKGNYDSTENLAPLNYQILLNGLSPPDGNLQGLDARPTPWDINSFQLRIQPESGGSQNIRVHHAMGLSFIADVSQLPAGEMIEVPEQRICFGRQKIDFLVNPQIGMISSSFLSANSMAVHHPTSLGVTPLFHASCVSEGISATNGSGMPMSSVSATLPEGFQYAGMPSLQFIPAGSTSTTNLFLDRITFPVKGVLGCGQHNSECVNISDEYGNYTSLSVSITDDSSESTNGTTPAYCITDGNLNLHADVGSDGVDVVRVAYILDPNSPDGCWTPQAQELCSTDCGSEPSSYTISLNGVESGAHALAVCATDIQGCNAVAEYPFSVEEQKPYIDCRPEIPLTLLDGESFIASTDPRVVDNLNAEVIGNCGLPAAIVDDRPAEFFPGQWPVTYTSEGIGPCTTTVIVETSPQEKVISFATFNAGIYEIWSHKFLNHTETPRLEYEDREPFHFQYNNTGTRLAVIPNGTGRVHIFNIGENSEPVYFPVPPGYTLHDIAFDPRNPDRYAIVGTDTANTDQHAIFVYKGNMQMSRFDLPLFQDELRISRPIITWSPDGSRISASFIQPAPAINAYPITISEWHVVDDALTLPPSGVSDNRTSLQALREIVYQDAGWRVLATEKMISLGISQPNNTAIGPVFLGQNADIDLTPGGTAAAIVQIINRLSGDVARVGYVAPLNAENSPAASYGPSFYPVNSTPTVAVSSDGKYAAVGLDGKILIFEVPGFKRVARIDVTKPINIEFRPF